MNRDKHNIIGQIQNGGWVEGGDSAAFFGHWLSLGKDEHWTGDRYAEEFEVEPGCYVRNPYPDTSKEGWASFSNGVYDGVLSRDQLTGVLHVLCMHKKRKHILRFMWACAKRGFIFTNNTLKNGSDPRYGFIEKPGILFFLKCIIQKQPGRKWPDMILWDIWAMMIRGLFPYTIILYPLLIIFDLHTIIGALLVARESVEEDDDVISHVGKCLVGMKIMPTPTMWIANRINSADDIMNKLERYINTSTAMCLPDDDHDEG